MVRLRAAASSACLGEPYGLVRRERDVFARSGPSRHWRIPFPELALGLKAAANGYESAACLCCLDKLTGFVAGSAIECLDLDVHYIDE